MGLLNGLSALGASTAAFAGTAGLEAQKASLAQDSLKLADQLATTRESAGRQEAGQIAATAQGVQNTFQAGQTAITEAGATARSAASNQTSLGVANISANAGADLRAAQAREADARTSLSKTELAKVNVVTGLQQNLADEYAKPAPDPTVIKTLGDQIAAQGLTASTRTGVLTSLDSLAKTEGMNVSLLTRQLSEETDKLGGMMLDPDQKARQQHIVDDLQQQLAVSRTRQTSFMEQARSVIPGGTGSSSTPAPAPSGPASTPPASFLNGTPSTTQAGSGSGATPGASGVGSSSGSGTPAPVSPSAIAGAPAISPAAVGPAPDPTAPGVTLPDVIPAISAPGAPSPAASTPKLPGDTGNATNLDVLKAARPDLNIDILKGRSPALIGLVMQAIDGRATLPPLGSRSPDAIMLRAIASQVDPSLDEASSKSRMATRVEFAAGPEARAMSALNTALGHAGVVADNFAALNNGSFPIKNWAGNAIESAFGDARQGNTQLAVNALASEARKVFAGANSGGSLTELEDWQKSFPVNGSPTQQKGALNQFVALLDSRLQSLGDQYNRGMGVTRDPLTFLEPHALQVMQQLTGNTPNVPVGNQLGSPPPRGAAARGASAPATPANQPPASANADLQRLWGQ